MLRKSGPVCVVLRSTYNVVGILFPVFAFGVCVFWEGGGIYVAWASGLGRARAASLKYTFFPLCSRHACDTTHEPPGALRGGLRPCQTVLARLEVHTLCCAVPWPVLDFSVACSQLINFMNATSQVLLWNNHSGSIHKPGMCSVG